MASRSGCKQIVKKGEGQKPRSALLAIQFWLIVSREGVIGEGETLITSVFVSMTGSFLTLQPVKLESFSGIKVAWLVKLNLT